MHASAGIRLRNNLEKLQRERLLLHSRQGNEVRCLSSWAVICHVCTRLVNVHVRCLQVYGTTRRFVMCAIYSSDIYWVAGKKTYADFFHWPHDLQAFGFMHVQITFGVCLDACTNHTQHPEYCSRLQGKAAGTRR
jgi:hypothetical protein